MKIDFNGLDRNQLRVISSNLAKAIVRHRITAAKLAKDKTSLYRNTSFDVGRSTAGDDTSGFMQLFGGGVGSHSDIINRLIPRAKGAGGTKTRTFSILFELAYSALFKTSLKAPRSHFYSKHARPGQPSFGHVIENQKNTFIEYANSVGMQSTNGNEALWQFLGMQAPADETGKFKVTWPIGYISLWPSVLQGDTPAENQAFDNGLFSIAKGFFPNDDEATLLKRCYDIAEYLNSGTKHISINALSAKEANESVLSYFQERFDATSTTVTFIKAFDTTPLEGDKFAAASAFLPDNAKKTPRKGGYFVTLDFNVEPHHVQYVTQSKYEDVVKNPLDFYHSLMSGLRASSIGSEDKPPTFAKSLRDLYVARTGSGENQRPATYSVAHDTPSLLTRVFVNSRGKLLYVPDFDNFAEYWGARSKGLHRDADSSNPEKKNGRYGMYVNYQGTYMLRPNPQTDANAFRNAISPDTYLFTDWTNEVATFTTSTGQIDTVELTETMSVTHRTLFNMANNRMSNIRDKIIDVGRFLKACAGVGLVFNESSILVKEKIVFGEASIDRYYLSSLNRGLTLTSPEISLSRYIEWLMEEDYLAASDFFDLLSSVDVQELADNLLKQRMYDVETILSGAGFLVALKELASYRRTLETNPEGARDTLFGRAIAETQNELEANATNNNKDLMITKDDKPDSVPYIQDKDPDPTCMPPHQIKVTKRMAHNPPLAVLGVDAGGGKTILIIHDAMKMLKQGLAKRILVLMPDSIVGQFCGEIARFTGGSVNVIPVTSETIEGQASMAAGSANEDPEKADEKGRFVKSGSSNWGPERIVAALQACPVNTIVVCGFEYAVTGGSDRAVRIGYGSSVVANYPVANLLQRCRFDYVAIDEAHRLKNEGPRFKAILRIIRKIPYKRLASGTLVANRMEQLCNVIAMLDPTILGDIAMFKATWLPLNGEKLDQLKKLLTSRCNLIEVRRVEWQEIIPPVTRRLHQVQFSPTQYSEYTETFGGIVSDITMWHETEMAKAGNNEKRKGELLSKKAKLESGDISLDTYISWAGMRAGNVHKLMRICNIGTSSEPSSKIHKVVELVTEHVQAVERGDYTGKIIVFCNMNSERDALVDAIGSALGGKDKVVTYRASTKQASRTLFEKDPNKMVMVGIQASMNTGLNLQIASRLIRFVPVMTPSDEEQGDARIVRPVWSGKDKRSRIMIDTVALRGSFDEVQLAQLYSKTAIATSLEVVDNEELFPDDFKYPDTYTGYLIDQRTNEPVEVDGKPVPAAGHLINQKIGPLYDDKGNKRYNYLNIHNWRNWKTWRDAGFPYPAPLIYYENESGNVVPVPEQDECIQMTPDWGKIWKSFANGEKSVTKAGFKAASDVVNATANVVASLIPEFSVFCGEDSPSVELLSRFIRAKQGDQTIQDKLKDILGRVVTPELVSLSRLRELTHLNRASEFDTHYNKTDKDGNYVGRLPRDENGNLVLQPIVREPDLAGSEIMFRIPYIPGMEIYGAKELGLLRLDDWWRNKCEAQFEFYSKGFAEKEVIERDLENKLVDVDTDKSLTAEVRAAMVAQLHEDATKRINALRKSGELPSDSERVPGYDLTRMEQITSQISSLESQILEFDAGIDAARTKNDRDSISRLAEQKAEVQSEIENLTRDLKDLPARIAEAMEDPDFIVNSEKGHFPSLSALRFYCEVGEAQFVPASKGRAKCRPGDRGQIYVTLQVANGEKEFIAPASAIYIIQRANTSVLDLHKRIGEMAGKNFEEIQRQGPKGILAEYWAEPKAEEAPPTSKDTSKKTKSTKSEDVTKPGVYFELEVLNDIVSLVYSGHDKKVSALLHTQGFEPVPDHIAFRFGFGINAARAFALAHKTLQEVVAKYPDVHLGPGTGSLLAVGRSIKNVSEKGSLPYGIATSNDLINAYRVTSFNKYPAKAFVTLPTIHVDHNGKAMAGIMIPLAIGKAAMTSASLLQKACAENGVKYRATRVTNPADCRMFFKSPAACAKWLTSFVKTHEVTSITEIITRLKQMHRDAQSGSMTPLVSRVEEDLTGHTI